MLDRKSTTSQFLHNLFLQHQLELIPQIELSSNDLLIDLARIGLGIAFIPDYCLNRESKDLFIVKQKKNFHQDRWLQLSIQRFLFHSLQKSF